MTSQENVDWSRRGIIPRPAGSANLGFALALRLRAGSRTRVLILARKSGRQDSKLPIVC